MTGSSGFHRLLMPQLGQAMVTGTIVAWHVDDGDPVAEGQLLLTIESDKTSFEIDAPAGGPVHHRAGVGEVVEVGTIIGTIGGEPSSEDEPVAGGGDADAVEPQPSGGRPAISAQTPPPSRPAATPRARAAAKGRIDLSAVKPSRADGMIDIDDVERAIAAGASGKEDLSADRVAVIDRLVRSWQQAPHFVQMIDVDAAPLLALLKRDRATQGGLTLNDLLIAACASGAQAEPEVNACVRGSRIERHAHRAIGLAVATPRGLRTPHILVDDLALPALAERRARAIDAAIKGERPADQAFAAFATISNLGKYGVKAGTPVLPLDQSVLVFAGAIEDRVVAVDGRIVIAPRMTLSIAFDHRLVDGLQAARFTAAVKTALELEMVEAETCAQS